jgi:hypothetical protein
MVRHRLLGTTSEKLILTYGTGITIKLMTKLRELSETFVIQFIICYISNVPFHLCGIQTLCPPWRKYTFI